MNNRQRTFNVNDDRPLPHNIDLERRVLAACLTNTHACDSALMAGINDNVFYLLSHAEIITAIAKLRSKGLAADIVTVSDALRIAGKLDGIGGEVAIAEIAMSIATTVNSGAWVASLLENYARRRLIMDCQNSIAECYESDSDIKELFTSHRQRVTESELFASGSVIKSCREHAKDWGKYFHAIQTGEDTGVIIPWGIPGFDSLIQLQRKQMMVLAAGSNTGKTRFLLNDLKGRVERGIGVAIFSHENPSTIITSGLVSIISGVPMSNMTKRGILPHYMQKIKEAAEFLKKYGDLIFIFGKGDYVHSPSGIGHKVRQIQDRTGGVLGAVGVDYIQNMSCDDKRIRSRVEQLDDIVLNLSNVSGDCNVALTALAQLNRDKDRDKTKRRPGIADIKGSSTIEQEADFIVFLHNSDREAQGEIMLDCYSEKVRGSSRFSTRMFFDTRTGIIRGIESRYGDEDNPEPINNRG